MARKKVREYDSKRLFWVHYKRLYERAKREGKVTGKEWNVEGGEQYQSRVVQGTEDMNWGKLRREVHWLSDRKLVVKPDMLFGQRGKHDLLLLNASMKEAEEFVEERLNREIEVKGVRGPVSHFIIEPFVPHSFEFYLSISPTRYTNKLQVSAFGGVEIETGWDEKVLSYDVEILQDIDAVDLKEFEKQLSSLQGISPLQVAKVVHFVRTAYTIFAELDFSLLEINPFVLFDSPVAGEQDVVALDMVAELDDTAFFKNRHTWLADIEFPNPFGRKLTDEEMYISELDANTGASLKLTILNPKGRIWNLVAGGGASVIFADTVCDLGCSQELANYGEYSGAPNEEETYRYAKTVLELATRYPDSKTKVLLVGGGIANFTDVAKTFKGIIHAIKEYKDRLLAANMKIYVRRAGPNYKAGLKLMRNLGSETGIETQVYGPETQMTYIVTQAINTLRADGSIVDEDSRKRVHSPPVAASSSKKIK